MIQPESVTCFHLHAFSHSDTETQKSLDTIATEFFGREYKSQQVGDSDHDMWGNEEVYLFRIRNEDDVLDILNLFDMEFWNSSGGEMVEVDVVQRWLDREPQYPAYQDDWEPERKHDTELLRAAPTADVVLAHLIKNDVLPYGDYLIEVSW